MACRIGLFMKKYYKAIHKLGEKINLNLDGHEWVRAKWSAPIRKYWRVSDNLLLTLKNNNSFELGDAYKLNVYIIENNKELY